MELMRAKALVLREVEGVETPDLRWLLVGLTHRLGETTLELADRCAVPRHRLEKAVRYVVAGGRAMEARDVLEVADSYEHDCCDILDPLVCALAVAVDTAERDVTRRDVAEVVNGTLECLDRARLPEYRDEDVGFRFPGEQVCLDWVEEEARRLVAYVDGVLDGRWRGGDPIDPDVAFARWVPKVVRRA